MGAWGCESCSNDNCWDMLGNALDKTGKKEISIHKITQPQANVVVEEVQKHLGKKNYKGSAKDEESIDALGCIIWLINHGLTVDVKILKLALETAKKVLADKDHIDTYCDRGEREQCLKDEVEAIQAAIKHGGVGQPKHVKGLMERMADKL